MAFILKPPSRLLVTTESLRHSLVPESEHEGIVAAARAEALAFLESVGMSCAKRRKDGSFRLSDSLCTREDPETGETIQFRQEELMTPEIRTLFEENGWTVVHSSALPWVEIWRG